MMTPRLTDPELLTWLARMRAEQPLWVDEHGGRHVFRYADVQAIVRDPERFSSNLGRLMPFLDQEKLAYNLVWADPPAHRPLRGLISHTFTPNAIAALRGRITEIADGLIAATPEEEFDFVEAVGCPLPIIVIAELLGVSSADREFFRDCADRSLGLRVDPDASQEELAAMVTEATKDLDAYLADLVEHRRTRPENGLLDDFIAAGLGDAQVCAFATLLLTAGYVTTTLLLGNALLCLRDEPAIAAALRADRSLIPAAVEEVLRVRPPIPQFRRITNEEVVLGGELIPANSLVTLWVLSANHDERQFADPRRFDLTRDAGRHLAFGHGIHFCLGAPLARLETEIALHRLFDEFADVRVGTDIGLRQVEFYGPERLPVLGVRSRGTVLS